MCTKPHSLSAGVNIYITHAHACTCTHEHAYTQAHIHTHEHAHIHTHAHTHTQTQLQILHAFGFIRAALCGFQDPTLTQPLPGFPRPLNLSSNVGRGCPWWRAVRGTCDIYLVTCLRWEAPGAVTVVGMHGCFTCYFLLLLSLFHGPHTQFQFKVWQSRCQG